ncbi:LOB domain-containing protein [Psidium guajava]|nr:LOB domain-containing protein [Psidium guajava]
MSCNGCRVLRKGCSDGCMLRQCLQLIDSPQAQAHATLFVAKFFGRAALMSFVSAVPAARRPDLFQSLLFEAVGRTINPVGGGGPDLDRQLATLPVGGRHCAPRRRAARGPGVSGRRPVVRSRPELGFGGGPRQASEPTIAAAAAARRADEDGRESARSVHDVSRLAAAVAGVPVGGGVGDDDDVAEWVVGEWVSKTRGEALDTVRVSEEVPANGTAGGF